MGRRFDPELGAPGKSFFEEVLPGVRSTLANRRKWVRLVRGDLARGLIMADDTAIDRIQALWPYEGCGGVIS